MSRSGNAVWLAALAGGVALFLAKRRRANASETNSRPSGAGVTPPPRSTDGAPLPSNTPTAEPPPAALPPTDAATAALPSWNRRTDDGGPPLYIADDVEALARVLASEIGSGTYAEQIAIGWIARNLARTQRTTASVARLVCAPCGESSGNARPFSTRQPATARTRQLAAMILASPDADDPTHGATHCFEPGLQDRMHASGRPGYGLDARGVRYCWLRGLDYYGTVGRWDLFGPKNGKGARPAPAVWNLAGFAVCCSGDKRPECRGKKVGDRVGG